MSEASSNAKNIPETGEGPLADGSRRRQRLLGEGPGILGALWVRSLCDSLSAEGRSIDGGWPGTLPEARFRVVQHFNPTFAERGMALLTYAELAAATAATYDRAKGDWQKAVRAAGRLQRASEWQGSTG